MYTKLAKRMNTFFKNPQFHFRNSFKNKKKKGNFTEFTVLHLNVKKFNKNLNLRQISINDFLFKKRKDSIYFFLDLPLEFLFLKFKLNFKSRAAMKSLFLFFFCTGISYII